MSQLTLTDIKRHCEALDFTDDDDLLQDLWDVAEEYVQGYVRRDLDTDLPGAWPKGCIGAVRMLVAHWYDNTGVVSADPVNDVPFTVRDMLALHRDLS